MSALLRSPRGLVRMYVLALGAGLLAEGGGLLLVSLLALPLPVGTNDTRHNLLHVIWGIGLLLIAMIPHPRDSHRVAWTALIFGVFYVVLGILGVVFNQPLGLQLGPGENAFHFIVGPLALVLGAWAISDRTARRAPPATL